METKTPSKIDNIKSLYAKVDKKTQFIIGCAKEVGNTPNTLRVHWFGQFWSIPEEHQNTVINYLQNTIKNQK